MNNPPSKEYELTPDQAGNYATIGEPWDVINLTGEQVGRLMMGEAITLRLPPIPPKPKPKTYSLMLQLTGIPERDINGLLIVKIGDAEQKVTYCSLIQEGTLD